MPSVAPADDELLPIERQIENAHAKGHAEGYAEGLAAAQTAESLRRSKALSELCASVQSAASAVAANRQAAVDELVADGIELVFGVLEEVVGYELMLRQDQVRWAVLRALNLVPNDAPLVLRVHPEAAAAAASICKEQVGVEYNLLEDPTIELTGCVVEAGACRIDAQLRPALLRVHEALAQLDGGPQ